MSQTEDRSAFAALFEDAEQRGFGCVLFDLQEDADGKLRPALGAGWASANGEKALRITGAHDLDTDIRWWTNLDRNTFWKSGCVRMKKLRESSFFKTDLGQLMREVGLTPKKLGSAVVCEALSEIFARSMRLAVSHYDFSELREQELVDELRVLLAPADASVSMETDEALSRAFLDYMACPFTKRDGARIVTLKRPRLTHAREVLESAVPEGAWDFYGPNDLPEEHARLDMLQGLKRPALVKVALRGFVEKCPTYVPPLLQLGEAVGAKGHKKERNWMTLQEVRYFSRFARVEIQAAFVAERWQELRMGKALLELGPLSDWSISLGLLAEAHWSSLASRSRHPVTKSKSMVSPRACWLRSADRFFCFAAALPLAAAGFSISGYGLGAVSVSVLPEDLGKLTEVAPGCGLLMPWQPMVNRPSLIETGSTEVPR